MTARVLSPSGIVEVIVTGIDGDLVTVRSTRTGATYVVDITQVVIVR